MQDWQTITRLEHRMHHHKGLRIQSVVEGVEVRNIRITVKSDKLVNGSYSSEHKDSYYCHCLKDLESTVIISSDHIPKCFVLSVIQVPADGTVNTSQKPEQLGPHVPGSFQSMPKQGEYFPSSMREKSSQYQSGGQAQEIIKGLCKSEDSCGRLVKKKRKGKQNGRLTRKTSSAALLNVYTFSVVSATRTLLNFMSWPMVVWQRSDLVGPVNYSSLSMLSACSPDSFVCGRSVRNSLGDDNAEEGLPMIYHCEAQDLVKSMKNGASVKMLILDEVKSKRWTFCLESFHAVISEAPDVKVSGFCCSNNVLRPLRDVLPPEVVMPLSKLPRRHCWYISTDLRAPLAAWAHLDHSGMSTLYSSQNSPVSKSFDPMWLNRVLQDCMPLMKSSVPGESPFLQMSLLFLNLELCSDMKEVFNSSYSSVSSRGCFHRGGSGNSNNRSGADSRGSRSYGRDSKGVDGYYGGEQGSSNSNHRSGLGGSSTSGGSGGSGGGNGNWGRCTGSSGGQDGCHADDDSGNGSEDDNDERHRHSCPVGSNEEPPVESLLRNKGSSPLDHGRFGVCGKVVGDQFMNGRGRVCAPTAIESVIENLNSLWLTIQKPSHVACMADPEEFTGPVPSDLCMTLVEEGIPKKGSNLEFRLSCVHMNGGLLCKRPETRENMNINRCNRVDNSLHGEGNVARGPLVNVFRQSINHCLHENASSSSSESARENPSFETVADQDSVKGTRHKKISCDEYQKAAYSKNMQEAVSYATPLRGKLNIRTLRNGTLDRGQVSDAEREGHNRSLSTPSTPNGYGGNISDCGDFCYSQSTRQDGSIYQPCVRPGSAMSAEQATQLLPQSVYMQLAEARLASKEVTQRPIWKLMKTSGDKEKSLARDKAVGDREGTIHWAQKWVRVEHKSGGLPTGDGVQSKLSRLNPTGVHPKTRENYTEALDTKGISLGDGDITKDNALCSLVAAKPLQRFLTFPSERMLSTSSRITATKLESLDLTIPKTVACEWPMYVEQTNFSGLLSLVKAVDNPPILTSADSIARHQSNVSEHTASVKSQISGEVNCNMTLENKHARERSTHLRRLISPAEEEMERMARAVLDAVHVSYRERRKAEGVVRKVGHSMAEFEKVLVAVTPSVPVSETCHPRLVNEIDTSHISSREVPKSGNLSCISCDCKEDDFSTFRCIVSDIPLNTVWKWYEEPSYYGVEVHAVDSQRLWRNDGQEEPFVAYFVPYLSGLQLFGYPSEDGFKGLSGFVGSKGKAEHPFSSQPRVFLDDDVEGTLFSSPGEGDWLSSPRRQVLGCANHECISGKDCNLGIQLLYEFFEADLPQVRQPLFPKVKELLEGVMSQNFHSRGDPAVLDGLPLGAVHPASWFAVAWYPIYRISEGPLRAVFLTYHSFDHFAPSSSLSDLMGTADIDDNISLPVVGLECYNIQAEPWLSMGGHFARKASKVHERLAVNPTECLEKRLSSLKEVAAVMARGISDEIVSSSAEGSGRSSKFKHSDYEFFLKRRQSAGI